MQLGDRSSEKTLTEKSSDDEETTENKHSNQMATQTQINKNCQTIHKQQQPNKLYYKSRQLSVFNPPTTKQGYELPGINAASNQMFNFYSDTLNEQTTQAEFTKQAKTYEFRKQRSTSFNEGTNFYQEQSKTCNLDMKSNENNDIQSKFFKYFKTQGRIRKNSLKQFSEMQSDNKSKILKKQVNGVESEISLYQHQNNGYHSQIIQQDNNGNVDPILDINKNYLYEEALDTIQNDDETNRQYYFELYKQNTNIIPTIKINKTETKKKRKSQCEVFLQGDISPWHDNTRLYFGTNQQKNNEFRSASSSSTPYAQQILNGFGKDNAKNKNNQNQTPSFPAKNIFGLLESDSSSSIQEEEVRLRSNLVNLKTKSQLLSEPHQLLKQVHQLKSGKSTEKMHSEIFQNKEVYNFQKRNSKTIQNTLRLQIKSGGNTESILGEVVNKQSLIPIAASQATNQQSQNPSQLENKIIVEMNTINGKENMPKFYNSLANTEIKQSVFPKIQQQFNLYKPNNIIFQSNQKYKSNFDNSSHNFNECITFLPKNLKNKILKQLQK